MAPNYETNIPESLRHIRAFFRVSTPARFFRVVSPLTVILLIISTVLTWNARVAWSYGAALALLILTDAITFAAHYPRNKIMFIDPLTEDTALLSRAARGWAAWNKVRVMLLAFSAVVMIYGTLFFS